MQEKTYGKIYSIKKPYHCCELWFQSSPHQKSNLVEALSDLVTPIQWLIAFCDHFANFRFIMSYFCSVIGLEWLIGFCGYCSLSHGSPKIRIRPVCSCRWIPTNPISVRTNIKVPERNHAVIPLERRESTLVWLDDVIVDVPTLPFEVHRDLATHNGGHGSLLSRSDPKIGRLTSLFTEGREERGGRAREKVDIFDAMTNGYNDYNNRFLK